MTERETEHVRMVDAGRLRAAFAPLASDDSALQRVRAAKFQCLAHSNTYGFSFAASSAGFTMTVNESFEASCVDYVKRKQVAIDHGQNATHVDVLPEPTLRDVALPTIAHTLALSRDELHLAVAYGDELAVFEVAELFHSTNPVALRTHARVAVEEIAWGAGPSSRAFAVLTATGQVAVYSLDGSSAADVASSASSVCWSPSGESLAVGLTDATIAVFRHATLEQTRTIEAPECCDSDGFAVHHVNWAEDDLLLAGFRKFDDEQEETTAFACLFESDAWLELDEVVAFYDVENRSHQYYSVFLADWRMFFIGCSLSADIELLVSDPESGEWEIWKPSEKYQARLPMNAQDEESYPLGLALNFNSSTPVDVDETVYAPAPLVSCVTTEGLLVNFAFIDMSVFEELPFITSPMAFTATATPRAPAFETATMKAPAVAAAADTKPAAAKPEAKEKSKDEDKHAYGKNDENEFAGGSDSDDDSDDEEAREEEAETARAAFRSVASEGSDWIDAADFPKLFKALRTTYSDEEHGKYLAKLTKDDEKVYEADFASWYVSWMFDDEDDSDADESDAEDGDGASAAKPAMKSAAEIEDALRKFKPAEGSWKCETCMVMNSDAAAQKCGVCEAANPNAPKLAAPVVKAAPPSTTASGGSIGIGAGGFSFGAPSTASSTAGAATGGFSFGVTSTIGGAASAAAPVAATGGFSFPSTAASGGFSFPSAATKSGETGSAGASGGFSFPSTSGTGFSFPSSTASGTGFSFPGASAKTAAVPASASATINATNIIETKPAAAATTKAPAAAAAAADTKPAAAKPEAKEKSKDEDKHAYGKNDENEFAGGSDSDDDSDDEEAREEEAETARAAFRSVASEGSDWIDAADFPKLFKALRTTYSDEEHGKYLAKLTKDDEKVYEADFASWYVSWMFDDEDDSDADESDAEDGDGASAAKPAMKSAAEIEDALRKFKPAEGSWKCETCMVMNSDAAAQKCGVCEAANPNAPKLAAPVVKAAPPSTTASGGSIGIGAGGFSFGAPSTASSTAGAATGGFSFGVTSTIGGAASAAAPVAATGGFSFPSTAASGGFSFPSTSGTGFSFPSSTASGTGFSFPGASAKTAAGATEDKKSPFAAATDAAKPMATTSASPYPPSTATKPAVPAFTGATAATPKASSYPPSTATKPAVPAFTGATATATTAAKASPYPPSTATKPAVPAFTGAPAAAKASPYPPSTATKPAVPAFTAPAAAKASPYPPSTATKPAVPAFTGAATTAAKASPYPPSTATKPAVPAFTGAATTAAKASPYPPSTATKPAVPAFNGASTTASASPYPPSTATKPAVPKFGGDSTANTTAAASQGVAFGSLATQDGGKTQSSPFSFSSFGGSLLGAAASTEQSSGTTTSLFGKPSAAKSLFGSGPSTESASKAGPQASPFGSVPKSDAKSAFSFPSASAPVTTKPAAPAAKTSSAAAPVAAKVSTSGDKKPTTAMPSSALEGQLWKLIVDFDKSFQRIKRSATTIESADKAFTEKTTAQLRALQTQVADLCHAINSLDDARDQIEKDVLFVIGSDGDVHEQLEYGREILASFKDEALKRSLEEQPLDKRSEETRQTLRDKFDQVEHSCADVETFVSMGSAESLSSANGAVSTAHLFRVLKQTYDNSKLQYNRVSSLAQQMDDLTVGSEHKLQASRSGASTVFDATTSLAASNVDMVELVASTEQRASDIRQHFLALCNNVVTPRDVFTAPRRKLTATSSSSSPAGASSPLRIKAYSKLMPRTQLTVASPMSSTKSSSNAVSFKGTDVKAGSRLFSLAEDKAAKEPAKFIQMPQRPKPSVGQAPERPAISGFGAPTAAKPVAKKDTSESAAKPAAVSFGASTSSSSQGAKVDAAAKTGQSSASFAFGSSESKSSEHDSKRGRNTGMFGSAPAPATSAAKPKAAAAAPDAEKKESPATSFAFGFGKQQSSEQSAFKATTSSFAAPAATSTTTAPAAAATDKFKGLLTAFYQEYNAAKVGDVEKTLKDYAGREEELFTKLFTKYVPGSKPEDVKKYLAGGPLPKKQTAAAATPAFGATSALSSATPFSAFGAPKPSSADDASKKPSPFGVASSSVFGAGAAAKPTSGFGAFGAAAAAPVSAFGQPAAAAGGAVDYRQKLVDFYTKHNPAKLSDVDATLAKYKGNEEKLFQNLAAKYKTAPGGGVPSSPAIQPGKQPSAAASPFGNAGSFSSISLSGATPTSSGFGSGATSGFGGGATSGFGAKPVPSTSPFGAASASPFGGASATPSAFGAPTALGGSSGGFGSGFSSAGAAATSSPFGGASSSPFGGSAFGAAAAGANEHREKLVKFYQQYNPEKLKDVDATLEKYKGQEARLFAMLEQKYLGKPAAAAAPAFGVTNTPSFGGGFGTPSPLGGAAPMFGSSSALGGSAQPAFGAPSAFGAAAPAAGGFSVQPAASTGATVPGSGFGSFSSQGASFGGFGAQASGATGGFGAAAPATGGGFAQFGGSSSFTQMRS